LSAIALLFVSCAISGCSDSETDAAQYAAQAGILLEQNRLFEAKQAVGKAISARDDVAEYHLLRGRIEFQAGAVENAYMAYSEALSLNPSSEEALQAISQLGLRVGQLEASIDATDKLLVLNPNQTDALLVRGLHALIRRNHAAATSSADQILSIDPLNEGGVVLKARASFLSGKAEEAAQILQDYERSRPNTQAVSLTRLEIYRALRNPKMMAQQFADLNTLLPDDLVIRLDHANFLYKTDKAEDATKLVVKVLANKAATRANVQSAVNLLEEYGISDLNAASFRTISSSGIPAARIALSRYFAEKGNVNAATMLLTGMTGVDAGAERAQIALLQGQNVRAQAIVQELLAKDETHCSALKTQALLWYSSGRLADSLRAAQSASAECPNRSDLWQVTAKVYSAMNDDINVRRVFAQGLDANKQSESLSRAYSGYLLAHNGSREAIAVARKLTRSAPALNSGWRLYVDICAKAKSSCVDEAKEGLIESQTRFGVDMLPGELLPNGLFGRLVTR
jgi:tetratricopeptide (TPR) repeat protein